MKTINTLEINLSNDLELKNILSAIRENVGDSGTGKIKCCKCGNKHNFDGWIYSIIKNALDEYVCTKCRKDG